MPSIAEESSILAKTRELCAHITEDPSYQKLFADVERFLGDDASRLQYQHVHERGEELHHKQRAGIELGAAEIREFESARESLFNNAVARDFLQAQRELEALQQQIHQCISLSLELGRVPTDADLEQASGGGCCGGHDGGGCGCH